MSLVHASKLPSRDHAEILQQLTKSGAWRLTPATMAYYMTGGKWLTAKHLMYVSARVAVGLKRGNYRAIINMPSRHGKSETCSVRTPIWYFDDHPEHNIILASYGAELAEGFSRTTRDIIVNSEQHLRCSIRRDVKAVDHFMTTAGGSMWAVGIGGTIIGRGANLLIIDDYHKNAKQAASETMRNDAWEWFISTAYTRLEPGGSIIIVAHRWNVDDIVGRLLRLDDPDLMELPWEVIKLPALALEGDVLGRPVGEPLWPERYSSKALRAAKAIQGEYYWQAMYQQDPVPPGAGLIAEGMLEPVDILPHTSFLNYVRFWDFAGKPEEGDWTVGALLARDIRTGLVYIVNIDRKRTGPAETEMRVCARAKGAPGVEADPPGTLVAIEKEPGSAGQHVVDYYQRTVLPGHPVIGRPASGDKWTRAQPFMAATQERKVKLKRASWNSTFTNELTLFPEGEFDDQVDAVSGAFSVLHEPIARAATWGRESRRDEAIRGDFGDGALITGATFGRRD